LCSLAIQKEEGLAHFHRLLGTVESVSAHLTWTTQASATRLPLYIVIHNNGDNQLLSF
jgi:hypothetical protein